MTGKPGIKGSPKRTSSAMSAGMRASSSLMIVLKPRIRELKFSLHLMSKSVTSIAGMILLALLVFVAAFPALLAEPLPRGDHS